MSLKVAVILGNTLKLEGMSDGQVLPYSKLAAREESI